MLPLPCGKIGKSLDSNHEILVISNFTLRGTYKNGTKIDFSQSGKFNFAKGIYEYFLDALKKKNLKVKCGEFGADMLVESINIGPINYLRELKC